MSGTRGLRIYRKVLLGTWGVALALAQALSCSMDTRSVSLVRDGIDTRGDASTPGETGEGGEGPGTAPVLAVEPAAIDFGSAVVGSPSRARLAVVNSGNAPLASPQVSMLAGSDPDFIVLHDQCDNAIGPSERCDVRLQLLPSKAGPSSGVLGVEGDGQSAEVALAGVGLESGPLTLAPAAGSSGDFGGVVLGSSFEAEFDLSNSTADPSGTLTFAVNETQFQLLPPLAGDCEPGITSLVDGQTCRIRVSFAPARRGAVDASLLVTSANLRSSSLPLAGVGRLPPSLVAPDTLEFGGVTLGSTGQRTFQVENLGDEPLQLSSVGLAGALSAAPDAGASSALGLVVGAGSAFSVQNSDCGAGSVLVGGARCGVTVSFRPLDLVPDQNTQLFIIAADGAQHAVNVTGSGIGQGALEISPAAGGSNNFGALAIGQSSSQTFFVTNPTAQPSGQIEFLTNDDFTIVERGAAGDCQSGVTSLVNGESCELAIALTPSHRGQHDGSLTMTSALAGAAHLALTGRGLGLAKLALANDQLDFGRVPTQTPVQQSVTVLNTGDQPLAAVQATLEGPGGAAPIGFSMVNACSGEVAVNSACSISVEFSASEAASYSAVLHLSSDAGATSALLLGLAFPRGSLEVTAGGGTDFGDVPLGAPRTIAFTLTNPSTTPSGRLTITSNSPLFTVDAGDCYAAAGAGLVNGQSCTFNVSFNPIASDVVASNLSVQSPGAGETALTLTGRGRTPPDLSAPGNRDFGVAIVNQAAVNEAANQFTWTVTNDGDLPSGVLQLTNANAEFVVSNDTCSGVSIPGHGSCSLDVRFLASAIGPRTANVVLTDPSTARVFTLVMTGIGRVIAEPGQSCANGATCASGECTGGVCCDRACAGTCQVCSATGVCNDQAAREACGNGNGRCFGVNQCLLPEGQPCSGGEQCGDGNCEPRLAGTGPTDRICCLDDCDSTGLVCNPQTGACQPPTLAAGAACGAAGQQPCSAGLECKTCLGGGNQCTPLDGCCGGCVPGYECIGGECGCPTGSNGVAQLDCGPGQCVLDREFACCAVMPDCPAARPVCDGAAGLCVQCLSNADCGPCATCSANNTCAPIARGQGGGCSTGQLCDGAGACFTPQCTGVGQCGDCSTCSNFGCVNAGQGAPCTTGVCTANQRCVQCVADAQCDAGQRCELSNNTCVDICVATARNCASPLDNDCDGRPDNTIDTVCSCAVGSTQACQTHPGQDGIGRCRAGQQLCATGSGNSSSSFGACTGSVGPVARDCGSNLDNDCDGRADNTIDNVCLIPLGGTGCTQDTQCASNATCFEAQCCEANCGATGRTCSNGACICPGDGTFNGTSCGGAPGTPCTGNGDCGGTNCVFSFLDADGDGFGSGRAAREGFCGSVPENHSTNNEDCCDTNDDVGRSINPNHTAFETSFHAPCEDALPFDYDCENGEEPELDGLTCASLSVAECTGFVWVGTPTCGAASPTNPCATIDLIGRPLDVCTEIVLGGTSVTACH